MATRILFNVLMAMDDVPIYTSSYLHCAQARVYRVGVLHVVHCLRIGILSTYSHAFTLECVSTHGINVLSKLMISTKLTICYLGIFNHVFVVECWCERTQKGQSMSGATNHHFRGLIPKNSSKSLGAPTGFLVYNHTRS